MAINIQSYNQILGAMVRKLIGDSVVNDVNVGSVILTLLEAAAQVDFENNASILNVLDLLSIDAVANSDLDNRAADYGLSRDPAKKSTGSVTITDSTFTKLSTGLYQVLLAPISGSTVIYVNDASAWANTGTLFIGRGTQNFEGPIAYTSITNNTSYFTIQLASALQNNHLISESVINAQGTTDRLITANTVVQIPANSQSAAVQFLTLRNAVIPAGETTITGAAIISAVPGSISNAAINTITSFASPPFTGATVSNPVALTNGSDVESDASLRERIKSYASTLARGTEAAILAAVIGLSDPDDSKQVTSAKIVEPAVLGDPAICYIDNGDAFQPTYTGQSVDTLLNSASGNEEFLQLSNFPLPRPQAINAATAPYTLVDQMQFRVLVDDIEETIIFSASQFTNISAALISEVIIAINSQSVSFKATFTNNSSNILLFPVKFDAETIQVSAIEPTDNPLLFANNALQFPTNKYSYIRLFQNNTLLHEQERAATLITTPFTTWNITSPGDLVIAVDGTPSQDRSFNTSDFGGAPFSTLTLAQWVTAFNAKFAGLTAVATSGNNLQLTSNKKGGLSKIQVLGGSYFSAMFGNLPTSSVGQDSGFQLNRQTGNLQILTTIAPGDSISAGIADAKGAIFSDTTTSGTYNVSTDASNRPATAVIVADSASVVPRTGINLAVGNTITVTIPSSNVMRFMASTVTAFPAIQPGDFVYVTSRGVTPSWVDPEDTGLFKVIAKGPHTTAGTDTYIDMNNASPVAGGPYTVQASEDIQAFSASTYPQLWQGAFTTTPAVASIQNIIDTLNKNIVNTISTVFKTDSVKITSSTENNDSIAIPVSVGNATQLFTTAQGEQLGNPSMIANQANSSDIITYFKRTTPTATNADGVSGKLVWFDRVQYGDIRGALTSDAVPGVQGVDTYGEVLQSTGVLTAANLSYDDVYNATSGANKYQYRSIRDEIAGDAIGTQFELPTTIMDYVVGDTFNLMRPIGLSSADSIVVVMDENAIDNTIDIPMWRTGVINNNFAATTVSFSATDADNQPGITFSNLTFWGKVANNTEFMNYAVWMQARNWYVSGGAGSGGGSFILRSNEYGPHGENIRFSIGYPSLPNSANALTQSNTPDYTAVTYFFGSGAAKTIGVAAGNQFTVTALGGDVFRYTFTTGSVNLSTVVVGDIVSILAGSGVSAPNSGQFRIKAVNIVAKSFDVYNPNGAATGVGTPEVVHVTTVADVIGTKTSSTVVVSGGTTGATIATKWFKLNDSAGSVAVYYTTGAVPTPASLGVNRIIPVVVSAGDSAATVTAETNGAIAADSQFTSSYFSLTLTVINAVNGPFAGATDGTSATGFSFSSTTGTYDAGLNGEYFILEGVDGSVGFWYDTTGVTPQPLINANRTVRIGTVLRGDSANTVASKTAVVVGADPDFSTTALGNVITVTDNTNGPRPAPSAGTSGFTVAVVTTGVSTAVETVNVPTSFLMFSLANTSVANIVTKINTSPLLNAVANGGASSITLATSDEVYTPAGPGNYSASLGYGHNPDPTTNLNTYITLYDGINWVKEFENTNPNFTLKTPMLLQGAAPSAYSVINAPNPGSAVLGEFFKLVPTTLNNVYHHMTQKALSQLPIVAGVNISNNIRRIQIKSKQLGSVGAVEVLGGNANNVALSIHGAAQTVPGLSQNFIKLQTAAFPVTLTEGSVVSIKNQQTTQRASPLTATDTIDVSVGINSNVSYLYNNKTTGFTSGTTIAITDVSAAYGRPSGIVWRWTHNALVTALENVNIGDMLNVYGSFSSPWSSGNKANANGAGNIAGFAIIAVNPNSKYIDVVNPYGVAMAATAIGTGSVKITPTPILQWNLAHAAQSSVVNVVLSAPFGTATVTTTSQNHLREGDTFVLTDNGIAQTGTVLTVVGPTSFTFTDTTGSPAATYILGNVIRSGRTPTRYRIESLGFNNLYRLEYVQGDAPLFVDCGVAVDDTLVLSGSTFDTSNNGRFQIAAVDNTSIVFTNPNAVEDLNTLVPFNNIGTNVQWTSDLNTVSGTAGSFENVRVGDWVKQPDDDASFFVQVTATLNSSLVPTTSALATILLLGNTYQGTTDTGPGVRFDEANDVNKGSILRDMKDVAVFNGDSVQVGDILFVDKFANASWFLTVNSGTYTITQIGTDLATYRPYVTIINATGQSQTGVALGVNLIGYSLTEGIGAEYSSVRVVENTAIDGFNNNLRDIYITPPTRAYKLAQTNGTQVIPLGKLQYPTNVTTGIDGYTYYTGLLQKVQHTIDGFEPDATDFPGLRAIGGFIETLAPLIHRVKISVTITTNNGVNLNEISTDVQSAILSYINGLGVGASVILSEITVKVMNITGVSSVVFTNPSPTVASISVADNEHAFAEPSDISIA